MNEFKALFTFNWAEFFIILITALVAIKFVWTLLEWFIVDKLAIETKKQRQKREEREQLHETTALAEKTAKNLAALEARHTHDEQEFRNNLNNYMEESRKDRKLIHDRMDEYANNRIKDRQQSLDIQKQWTISIQSVVEGQKALKDMFLDGEIDSMRWDILNFCSGLSNGKKYNRESFAHIFRTYGKYETILKENGLKNGLIEESMDYIRDKYHEELENGTIKE